MCMQKPFMLFKEHIRFPHELTAIMHKVQVHSACYIFNRPKV